MLVLHNVKQKNFCLPIRLGVYCAQCRVPYIWSDTTHNRTLKKTFLTCKTFFIIHHFKEQECLTCSSKFQALTKFSAEVTWLKRRLTDHPKNRSIFSIFRTRNFAHYLVQFQTIPSKPQEPWSISKKLMQHSWHFLLLHRKTRVIKVAVLLIYIDHWKWELITYKNV